MVDSQSTAAEIRQGKKERKKKPQGKNIMVCPTMIYFFLNITTVVMVTNCSYFFAVTNPTLSV